MAGCCIVGAARLGAAVRVDWIGAEHEVTAVGAHVLGARRPGRVDAKSKMAASVAHVVGACCVTGTDAMAGVACEVED